MMKRNLGPMAVAMAVIVFMAGCSREAKVRRHLQRADQDFGAGEYDKAKIEYMRVLQLNPKHIVALQQIGIIWLDEGEPLLATRFLAKARDLGTTDLGARVKLSTALLALDTTLARKEALAILDRAPGNEEAILLLSETARTPEDNQVTAQRLEKVTNHDTAAFQLASAAVLFRKGDRVGGEAAIKRALELAPKSPEAHLAMATFFFSKKDTAKAAAEYKTAAELSPPRGPARLKYAEFQLLNGALEDAKAIATEMTTQTPDYLPAWLMQAQVAFAKKDLDQALALSGQVLGRDGANGDARFLRARVWIAKGDSAKAIAELQALSPIYASFPMAKYYLAMAYLQNGDTAKALDALNQAVAANPNYLDALLLQAVTNLKAKNPEPVVSAMSKLLKAQPDSERARVLLADAYRALGRLDDAAVVYGDQIKRNPNDAQAYFMLGMTLRENRKPVEARAAFEKAHQFNPKDLTPIYQLVELDLEAKNFDAALQRVEEQIQADPKSSAAWYLKGKVFGAKKDWPQAEAALTKAVELNPNATLPYEMLVSVYMAQNKSKEAISEVQAALAKDPSDVTLLMVLGQLYSSLKDDQKAEETYERLLAAKPDFGPALNDLAYSYAEHRHDLDKALEFARKAHTLLPKDSRTTDTLGWILYRKGDYPHALPLLQDAAANSQASPEILYHLGMALYMMNDRAAARTALQQAARSTVDFPGKAEIASRLAVLGDDSGKAPERSTEELEALLQKQPDDIQARLALGEAWEKKGDPAKAAAAYEFVVSRNATLLAPTLKLAQLNDGPLKNPGKALELGKKARELAPSDARVAGIVGGIAYRSGNYPFAYGLLQEAILPIRVIRSQDETLDVKAAATLHDFAWAAYVVGKVAEAKEAMQRLVQAGPESADARLFLAMLDLEDHPKDSPEVAAQVAQLLETKPDYIPALVIRAELRAKKGEVQQAEVDLTALLKRYPDLAPAQKLLAAIDAQDPAKLATAYDLAAKAHKALPDDAELSRLLAEISFQRKEYPYAIQLFRQSAKDRPLDSKSLYSLGMALHETGQKVQSRETLQQALSAGLPAPLSAEATRIVAELSKK